MAKFLRLQAAASAPAGAREPSDAGETTGVIPANESTPGRHELLVRALAIPAAVVAASITVAAMPFASRLVAMWIHECGHAVAAWVSGYFAFPGPWVTPVGTERSFMMTLLIVGGLGAGLYAAWQRAMWVSVAAAGVSVAVTAYCTFAISHDAAQQLILFAGDGGAFVLGTALMLTMYAPAEHPFRREGLRWGLLAIGAVAFMDARATWSGRVSDIPFGEDARGLSDPSVLMEQYNWSVAMLAGRYEVTIMACVVALTAAYVGGLFQVARAASPRRQIPSSLSNPSSPRKT